MILTPRGPLIVRLCNWVGEVVLSVPTLRRLADAGCELHLVGRSWAQPLLDSTGWPMYVHPSGIAAAVRSLRGVRKSLGLRSPSILLMTKSLSSAIEARLAGLRPFGYAYDGRSFLLSAAYSMPRLDHASHLYWNLASRFLGTTAPYPKQIELGSSSVHDSAAHALLEKHGLAPRGFALMCPFSGADDAEHCKVWPGFAALSAELANRGVAVVVCPGPGEEAVARATLPAAIRLDGVNLGVYGALQRLAMVVVANDTGPAHLAAAVGGRLIAIYGPRSVRSWEPVGSNVVLLHHKTGWPTLDEVLAAVLGP